MFDSLRLLFHKSSYIFRVAKSCARALAKFRRGAESRSVSAFYRINPRPIRRAPAIFTGSPHKSLLYSAGSYSPGENAAARQVASSPLASYDSSCPSRRLYLRLYAFLRSPVFFHFASDNQALFLLLERSIFPRLLIRASAFACAKHALRRTS